ncbi:tRNA pseudouridine synthase [Methanococcus vannielii SB]|uniref:tRNA pseudouridine synthase n=1 Tax=Methanococcus vannielii (strain ATCC 35089 / DSM 1224 / JCM 13029 / OCM 148 / SB) TaxID=406327 RepID=A6URQ5_METVS|nr:tRNA pseudouridine(38-40) synthase TruA [Methanococcus vannielii]ABR55177.1 tRNA pseudouridine synthase [Methanococcus vannielii SB]
MYIFKIAYDGRYSFQSQPHRNTVCDKITDTLLECGYLKEGEIPISYGGRTDLGVSALGNYIVYNITEKPVLSRIYSKLHKHGIWILGFNELKELPDVKYRHYRYILPNTGQDIELMKKASEKLIGTHSFHNLSKRDKTKNRSPIRTIYNIKIAKNEYFITIEIFGKSFLWNMVRKIVRLLSNVGLSKYKEFEKFIDDLLDRDVRMGVQPASAEGLILVDVKTNTEFKIDEYTVKKFDQYFKKSLNNHSMNMGLSKTMLSKNQVSL